MRNKKMKCFAIDSFFLATTEGFQGKEIDTTYFYTSIAGWDLRLALAIDQFDLVQTTMIPSAKPRSITTQLEDYLASDKNMALAHKMIPDLKFINDGNCKATGSSVDFSNCIPDEYCERVLRGETHPLGVIPDRPACVVDSTCECEPHRWPVGLTAKNTASLHVAPKSLLDQNKAFDLQDGTNGMVNKVNLTYDMTRFLNREDGSENPRAQQLRPGMKLFLSIHVVIVCMMLTVMSPWFYLILFTDSIEHALTSSPIIEEWVRDQRLGVHNDTVWLYYGSATGMSIIFPPNNWGFLWGRPLLLLLF
jgi:hypothetical protein